ncbi:MAG: transporter substrate-binding domain-containing protein, partial [Achromobacter marplatensis]|uniref:transporter substrate-binding domain-containing protein n=1 Tax=Achromobacter marplatensis TaxID=470868 RepID=UPI003D04A18E
MRKFLTTAVAATLLCVAAGAQAGVTFDAVKKKGFLQCGFAGIPGFSVLDSKGEWTGLDVDMCRAVAAALFGDASKVKGNVLTAQAKFTALQSGEIDMLSRNTTQTLTRDTTLGLIGVGVNFYDAQGLIVKKSMNVKSVKELDGATICVQPGTTTELNLADYFRSRGLTF